MGYESMQFHDNTDKTGFTVDWFTFSSRRIDTSGLPDAMPPLFENPLAGDDNNIGENLNFKYPVLYPSGKSRLNEAVLLLHGLNERSWAKYFPWAQRISGELNRPVILFPISFHMNRSPREWSNPRAMMLLLKQTRLKDKTNTSASFANLALSLRLSENPLRFFSSGSQSLGDLTQLIRQVSDGGHKLFEKGTRIDIFAYSIGAFLAQILLLNQVDQLLSDSRLFMFCGGAAFNKMNGVSKLIMDEEAFARLRYYYIRQFERLARSHGSISSLSQHFPGIQAFLAMLDASRLKQWRRERFDAARDRIAALALSKDRIIPALAIRDMVQPVKTEILDFTYPYSHENPFPLFANGNVVVDQAFDSVFNRACAFLR